MMEIRKTDDGSHTLWSKQYGETYHSAFGAVTESMHVFIKTGFEQTTANPLYVFEMGFGTGLNSLLTCVEAQKQNREIIYDAIELHPIPLAIVPEFEVNNEHRELFNAIHQSEWNSLRLISPGFSLKKIKGDLHSWIPENKYHLVYFDAFSPETQPELWSLEILEKMYAVMHPRGILTTYCAKGAVRRNLIAAGFRVERLPGPPGKREILRAIK